MNTNYWRVSIIAIAMLLTVFSGMALGAISMPASNESSQITVHTSATAIGNLYSDSSLGWEQSNGDLATSPPLLEGQGYAAAGYSEDTTAYDGEITYQHSFEVDTGNQLGMPGQQNVESERIMSFDSSDGNGAMISEEAIAVDVASTAVETDSTCCAWGLIGEDVSLPAYHETVEAGSSLNIHEGAVVTEASTTFIAETVDVPVELGYGIDVHGINQTDPNDPSQGAIGSASAYIDANIQTGNDNTTSLGTDMEYHEVTSVEGLFTFAQEMQYTSSP